MTSRYVAVLWLAIALMLGTLARTSWAACPDFAPVASFTAGTGPRSVAAGDFNGDGKRDLAVANLSSDNVSILLGNGNGTFAAAINSGTGSGSNPTSVAIGDFNGDGKLDLATANFSTASVAILLGNGNGTFLTAAPFAAGTQPIYVAAGDFNGDGKLDLASANFGSANVSILLGNGNGTFLPANNYSTGAGPDSIAIGDFNGDGKPDLAIAGFNSNNVTILLGNGDGTFATALNPGTGTNPEWVAIGDFNGDGKVDLGVPNNGSNDVSIILGNGNGTFAAAVPYSAGTGPRSVAIGDFNGDGKSDLAVANFTSGNISIVTGNGDGTFATAINYGAGASPQSVAIGDFDGDGKPDLAVGRSAGSIGVLLNIGFCSANCGTFAAAVGYNAGVGTAMFPRSVAIGDFNRDGKLDLATANNGSFNISILLGNGNGTFAASTTFTVGLYPESIAMGDFNGDGKLDLVTANSGPSNVSVLLANGNGTFATASYGTGTGPHSVAIGDFNGDGKLDLVTANQTSNNVSVLLGNGSGNGTFLPAVQFATGTGPDSVAIGDFNGDGRLDLVTANQTSNNVSVLLGNGNGTFLPAVPYGAGTGPASVAIGDFNRDGKLDLAVANETTGSVSILLGNGNGIFGSTANFSAGTAAKFVAIGDFNGDGTLDLAVSNTSTNNVAILLGNGNGTFALPAFYGAGSFPEVVAVGDFNGDGKPDLAVSNPSNTTVSILLNTCPASAISGKVFNDLNGNGAFDPGEPGKVGVTIQLNTTGPTTTTDVNGNYSFTSLVAGTYRVRQVVPAGNTQTTADPADLVLGATQTAAGVNFGDFQLITISGRAFDDLNGNGVQDAGEPGRQGVTIQLDAGANGSVDATTLTDSNGNYAFANLGPGTYRVREVVPAGRTQTTTNPADIVAASGLDVSGVNFGSAAADMTITKTHTGNFTQGDTGKTYTITVNNIGPGTASGTVTMSDTLPTGLTLNTIGGAGWTCNFSPLCTRSDALAAGASYPAIILTVNVTSNAPASVTNSATVSGGGELNTANDTANDQTTIIQVPDLTITKTHTGNFTQGDTGKTYTITVNNIGGMSTAGTVTVTDTLPASLTATAISGTGWTCTLGTLTCTRSDALASAASYPAITLTVNVSNNAPASGTVSTLTKNVAGAGPPFVINSATVSGGGEVNTANDTASDVTLITQVADLSITKTHAGSFTQGQAGATYTITVNNIGAGSTNGTVTMTDTLPTGLSATAISGTGWTCTLGTLTCTRSDILAAAVSYPAITLTVNVAGNAAASVINAATVSGGGELNTANDTASDQTTITSVFPHGDANGDGSVTVADVFYLINYLFTSGPSPVGPGDVNGDGQVSVADIFYLINYLFAGGPAPL